MSFHFSLLSTGVLYSMPGVRGKEREKHFKIFLVRFVFMYFTSSLIFKCLPPKRITLSFQKYTFLS